MADVITRTVDLGIVTAYAEAVEAGYTGTEEEFAEGLRKSALYADNAQASATEAERQAGLASDSATEASGYASDAEGYKDSASGYADDASGYASDAQGYASDAQASAEQAEQTLNSYAKVDGFYEEMTVGSAEQLLSSTYLTDEAPYNFRTSGGALEIGNRETDEIIGGSVVWNQLAKFEVGDIPTDRDGLDFSYVDGKSFSINGIATNSSSATGWFNCSEVLGFKYSENHKILVTSKLISGTIENGDIKFGLTGTGLYAVGTPFIRILQKNNSNQMRVVIAYSSGVKVTNAVITLNAFDLTAMFGSTIADYIYTLEQSTAGSGIAKLKSWGFFLKDYYAYSEPTFKHVDGLTSHKMVGFNQWDEEWEVGAYNTTTGAKATGSKIRSTNKIPVIPNTEYYCNSKKLQNVCAYNATQDYIGAITTTTLTDGKTFTTPADCHYIAFNLQSEYGTTYNHDICINFHYDGERDGEYEAYAVHSYALDDDVVLRGIPKLDTDNNLYYDGDTYESDGTVTRRYGIVDLGTLNWSYNSTQEIFIGPISNPKDKASSSYDNALTTKYDSEAVRSVNNMTDKHFIIRGGTLNNIYIKDSAYTDATTFTTAMSGVYLVYELETPTTESADAYQNPQIVDNWGTEEYIGSEIPVGHSTKYPPDLKAKVEVAPNAPTSDGLYLMKRENGENSYIAYVSPLPSVSEDGTFVLKATKSGGTTTLSWVAES